MTRFGCAAGALAVEDASAEKDWFVVHAIERLAGLGTEDFTPALSGGYLLKAHGLIRRFSEDLAAVPEGSSSTNGNAASAMSTGINALAIPQTHFGVKTRQTVGNLRSGVALGTCVEHRRAC